MSAAAPGRAGRPVPVAAADPAGPAKDPIFGIYVRGIWNFLKTQPASFWMINVYMFLEYVRPASVWPSLDILPWSWISIILCVLTFVMESNRVRVENGADKTLLVFTGIVLVSCLFAYSPGVAVSQLGGYLTWVLMYFLIAGTVNTERRFLVFILAFMLYNMKMAQNAVRSWAMIGFGWSDWGATGGPGWFQNSGEFGIEMTIFFPVSLYFWLALKKRWGRWKSMIFLSFPVASVMGMIASSSRGAVIGGAAVGLVLLLKSRYKLRSTVIAAVVAFLAVTLLPDEQVERFDSAGEDSTSTKRLTLWKNGIKIANEHPVFGIGYRNWMKYYRENIPGDWAQLPHNIFIEAWAELGYVGLFGFIAMILATLWVNWETRKLAKQLPDGTFIAYMAHGFDGALVGFLVSGFFVTVLYYPFFWINLAMTSALYYVALNELKRAKVNGARGRGRRPVSSGPPGGSGPPMPPRRPSAPAPRLIPQPRFGTGAVLRPSGVPVDGLGRPLPGPGA